MKTFAAKIVSHIGEAGMVVFHAPDDTDEEKARELAREWFLEYSHHILSYDVQIITES